MNLAPIALFVYNRPDTTLLCLQHLKRNRLADRSVLYIFSDGPKPGAGDGDLQAVREVRKIIRTESWCRKVYIEESPVNLGLSRSIIGGVTRLVQQFGKIIVLEDDLLTSTGFLEFMNGGLERYADEERVFQVNGYLPPIKTSNKNEAFFLPLTSTWGWATWERAWKNFEEYPSGWEKLLIDKELKNKFDLGNSYPYTDMLQRQMRGEIDSWGIRWWWSVFKHEGLGMFPDKTLIKNIGFENNATHTTTKPILNDKYWHPENIVNYFPEKLEFNYNLLHQMINHNFKLKSIIIRIFNKIINNV